MFTKKKNLAALLILCVSSVDIQVKSFSEHPVSSGSAVVRAC